MSGEVVTLFGDTKTNLTVETLATKLRELGDTQMYEFEMISYRGFYEDIALWFDYESDTWSCSDAADYVERQIGNKQLGYKGGEFITKPDTRIWLADWGELGEMVTDIFVTNGNVVTLEVVRGYDW